MANSSNDSGNPRTGTQRPTLRKIRCEPKRCIFLFLTSLIIVGCGPSQPRLPPLPPDALILAFGDSLTAGVGASRGHDYPSILAQITGFNVVNAGVPTEVTEDALRRLPRLLDQLHPHLLVMIHGGNDFLRHKPAGHTAHNLKAMISAARDQGVGVVMLGVPQPSLFVLSSAEIYRQIADETSTPIDTETLPQILGDAQLKSDLVHPNDAGYQRLAEAVRLLLTDSGAILHQAQ